MRIHKRLIKNTPVRAYNDSGVEWVVTVGEQTQRFPKKKFTLQKAMNWMVEQWGEKEHLTMNNLEHFFADLFLFKVGEKVRVNLGEVETFLMANISDDRKIYSSPSLMTERLGDIVEFSIENPARKLANIYAIDAAEIIENMDDLRTLQAQLIEDEFSNPTKQ